MQKLNRSKYITSKQFAAALDVSDRQFRRYRAAGKLPDPLALPGALLWSPAAVKTFITQATQAA